MPKYVDGFVVPVPKKKLQEYCAMAQKAGPFDAKRMIYGGFAVLVQG